jgi:hypothetical protein
MSADLTAFAFVAGIGCGILLSMLAMWAAERLDRSAQ